MFVDFNILNQLGSPSINSNTFANRPAAGQTGRLFVSTDTFEIYRDNGTTWDLIGGPGSSTITGTGTATQVAYFTSSQAIGSSSNLYWDNTNIRLGIGTSTPGTRLDIHGTGIMQHINATGATANSLMAFQRTGTNVWRLGDQYNGGNNFFEIHNIALANNAIQIDAATNKSIFTSVQNYVSGLARANYFDYTLNLPNGTTISSPNAVTTLGSTLNLNIAGSATLPNGARSGMDVFNGVNFTSAGTFTINQASTIRAFSNLTSGWAFNGSAVGTITHLAGMRVLFPTNSGTSINVTTNYGLLINDQTANTGTITYTNRWGIYQEGASDLNYFAANLLLGSTVNNGNRLQVTGNGNLTGDMTADAYYLNGMTAGNGALYWTSDRVTLANYNANGVIHFEVNGGAFAAMFNASGNFGINTTNPSTYKLQVDGSAGIVSTANAAIEFGIRTPDATFNDSYLIFGTATSNRAQIQVTGSAANTGNMIFTTYNAGAGAEQMRITSGGEVFIGTTSGSFDTGSGMIIKRSGVSTIKLDGQSFGGEWSMGSSGMQFDARVGYIRFITGANSGSAVERMRITDGGNVLIGTTTDAGQKLQVNGTGYFAAPSGTQENLVAKSANTGFSKILIDAVTSASSQLALLENGSQKGVVGYRPSTGNVFIANATGDILEITSSGNVQTTGSIKTAAPTSGTAAAWKLGSRVAATVVLNTTEYIEVDIGGTLYKLATVT